MDLHQGRIRKSFAFGLFGRQCVLRLLFVLALLWPSLKSLAEEGTEEGKDIEDVVEKVLEEGEKMLDETNSLMKNTFVNSMPVTIPYMDNSPFTIRLTFDSLRFIRGENLNSVDDDHSLVNVDATFKFPFAVSADDSHIVRFHGDGIRLEGGNSTSRISLVSNHQFELMKDRVTVEVLSKFPKGSKNLGDCASGDSTWLEFDCNGVRDMSLCGRFLFSKTFLEPATKNDNDTIMAYFSFTYSKGMIAKICLSDSFKIKGCGDFVYKVTDAIVDLSDTRNGYGFSFPDDEYWQDGLSEEAWTGFFLKMLSVRLPKELDFNKNEDKQAKVEISTVLIDDYGFTGDFRVTDLADTDDGAGVEGELALSVDTIFASFRQNSFNDGRVIGKVNVPFLDKSDPNLCSEVSSAKDEKGKNDGNGNGDSMSGYNLAFAGNFGYSSVNDQFSYSLNVSLNEDKCFKVPFTNKANIEVYKNSYLELGTQNSSGKFAADLCLNGALNIESSLDFKGVAFEELKLSTAKPYVSVKAFALKGKAGFTLGGFSLELKKFGLVTPHWTVSETSVQSADNENSKADLDIEAQISLMAGSGGIAAGVGVDVHAIRENRWKVDGLTVDKIMLDLDFSAFHLKGEIERFNEDASYGTGFRGGVDLSLKEFGFGIDGDVTFGKKDEVKYWFTKADADVSAAKIMLFPPAVFVKSFSGGAYYHMNTPRFNNETVKLASSKDYTPTDTVGLGLLAGLGVYFADDKLCSANVEFEMNFNDHWGVNYVGMKGIASILASLEKGDFKSKGKIGGTLETFYDRPNKTFHAEIDADVDFEKILSGNVNMQMHSDPKEWYCWMGTRSNPNSLNFVGLVDVSSYFMLGVIEKPMPLMIESVAAKLGFSSTTAAGQEEAISKGNGFAFGVKFEAEAETSIPLDIIYANFGLYAGTDLLVEESKCGRLDWRASGQAYVAADGCVGVTVYYPWWCKFYPCIKGKKIDIFNGSVLAALSGEVPAPARVSGKLGFKCSIIFINLPTIDVDVTVGEGCKK